jgi:hypothetical protein
VDGTPDLTPDKPKFFRQALQRSWPYVDRMVGIRGGAVVGVGLGLVLALAGCAGTNGTAAETVTTSASSATTPSPTNTTKSGATVAQYSSIVAKQKASIGKTLDMMLSDTCDWTTPGSVDTVSGSSACGLSVLTVNFEAQTLQLVFVGAQKPGAPAYIGAPPDEIKSLVSDTKAAADTLASTSDKANPCTAPAVSPDSAACVKALFDFYRAMTDMKAQFAAWGPYGV